MRNNFESFLAQTNGIVTQENCEAVLQGESLFSVARHVKGNIFETRKGTQFVIVTMPPWGYFDAERWQQVTSNPHCLRAGECVRGPSGELMVADAYGHVYSKGPKW